MWLSSGALRGDSRAMRSLASRCACADGCVSDEVNWCGTVEGV